MELAHGLLSESSISAFKNWQFRNNLSRLGELTFNVAPDFWKTLHSPTGEVGE